LRPLRQIRERFTPSSVNGDVRLPPEELLHEHSYLVARGVRPLALVGHCFTEPMVLLRIASRIEMTAAPNVVPFVLDHGDGTGSFGYAGTRWALDLYEWAVKDGGIPEEQRERIIGLLLGYATPAVARYEEEATGRRFAPVIPQPPRASSCSSCDTSGTAGTYRRC
jgi:hypothetical protein